MDQHILLDIARLVRRQSTVLLAMTGMLLVGLGLLGLALYAIKRGLQGIAGSVQGVATSVERTAQMTTEVLRRVPERSSTAREGHAPMPFLTEAQQQQILTAFTSIDPYAYVEYSNAAPRLYYEGYITVEGLLHLAVIIAQMHAEAGASVPQRNS